MNYAVIFAEIQMISMSLSNETLIVILLKPALNILNETQKSVSIYCKN